MKKYTPRYSDPRVHKRIIRALGFALSHLSNKPRALGTRYIDRYLGAQNRDLGRYLRQHLLIETSVNWSKDQGRCKEYVLNASGVAHIRAHLNIPKTPVKQTPCIDIARDHDIVWHFLDEAYGQSIRTNQIQYQDRSDRLWHDLQNVKKIYKQPWLAQQDLAHQYDIETAAPRLLLQRAYDSGLDLYLRAINEYIAHKNHYRQVLSKDLGISTDQVKVLINALMSGARLGSGRAFALGRLLGSAEIIARVKQHEFIQELRSDIKTIWQYIAEHRGYSYIRTRRGHRRRLPLSPRIKWQIYFQEERRCLNACRHYLEGLGCRYFLEHDGWTCDQVIDQTDLCAHIQNMCGRSLQFQYQHISLN